MSAQGRVADALLRTLGGRTVLLRVPVPAVPGDLGEQVGLAVPLFQDMPLTPVALRRVFGRGPELLVSAAAVAKMVGSLAFDSADVLFATAAGVVVDGRLLLVDKVMSAEAFGEVYLYRLALHAAVSQGV